MPDARRHAPLTRDSQDGTAVIHARLFKDEIQLEQDEVQDLVSTQFPEFSALPVVPLSAGTDNRMYRLGEEMLVRIPRTPSAALQLEKEQSWLGFLGGRLPLEIPRVIGFGTQNHNVPYRWSIYSWIDGQAAASNLQLADSVDNANRLADWVRQLASCDAALGPPPGPHNFHRGSSLNERNAETCRALLRLSADLDPQAAFAIWAEALEASTGDIPVTWIHGDLQPGNVLLRDDRISAVIDFGGLGVGDPACDLLPCWTMFGEKARSAYRDAMEVDDRSWARARGWALTTAAVAYAYYSRRSPFMTAQSLRTLKEVIDG